MTTVAIAFAAEIGTEAGMAAPACLDAPAYEGLGSTLVGKNSSVGLLAITVTCFPVVVLAPITDGSTVVAAFYCGPAAAPPVRSWGRARLGGVLGGLLGATDELARAAVVHVGVATWTLS